MLVLVPSAWAAEKVRVVASFSIIGDLVAAVGGDRVEIHTLVGPDQDAHVFEPRPADNQYVAQARLVVLNGLGFEGWISRLTKSAGFKGTTLVASQGIKSRQMEDEDHPGRKINDPHAWQDPRNVVLYVTNIAKALSDLDPDGAASYQENSKRYIGELQALDAWAVEQYGRIAPAKRRLITSHDAFGYHSARYGIQFIAPQGISTDGEPSAKDVSRLIRQIKQERIKALFVENMSNPRLLEQLAKDTGVTPSGKLYVDALSAPDGPAPTYLKLMRYNVEQIAAGLQRN